MLLLKEPHLLAFTQQSWHLSSWNQLETWWWVCNGCSQAKEEKWRLLGWEGWRVHQTEVSVRLQAACWRIRWESLMGRREWGCGDAKFRMMTKSQAATPEVKLLKKRWQSQVDRIRKLWTEGIVDLKLYLWQREKRMPTLTTATANQTDLHDPN